MANEKPTRCPKCRQFTLYHNKGISKAGNHYENYKCKCGYLEWVDTNKNDSTDSSANDNKNDIIIKIQNIQDAQKLILDEINELKGLL